MRRRRRKPPWTLLLALAALPVAAAVAQAPTPAQIDQAIHDLADDRFQVRERASNTLFHAGPSIEGRLTDLAAGSTDPEVRARAERLLGEFSLGLMTETPAAVTDLLQKYLASGSSDRQIVLNQLSRQGGFGYLVLLRIAQEEVDDPAAKAKAAELARGASPELTRTASELLAAGQGDTADRLLTLAAKAGDVACARALGARLNDEAAVKALVDRWQTEPPTDPEVAKSRSVAVAMLWRAVGRLDRALESVDKLDPELSVSLAAEADDPAAVARLAAGLPGGARRSAVLATAAHFTGNDVAFVNAVNALRAEQEDLSGVVLFQTLALSDGFDEAAGTFLARPENFSRGFEMLLAAERYAAAERMLAKGPPAGVDPLTARAMKARLDAVVGRTNLAIDEVTGLAKEIEAHASIEALIQLAQCESWLCRRDAKWQTPLRQHALAALMLAGPAPSNVNALRVALPYTDPTTAARWWDWLRTLYPDRPPTDRLNLVASVLYHEIKPPDLASLAKDLLAAHPFEPGDSKGRAVVLAALADAYAATGAEAGAKDCVDRLIALHEAALNGSMAGRVAAQHHLWERAAKDLGANTASPADAWLRAYCLTQGGRATDGDALMADASRRALTDADFEALAGVMTLTGQRDAAVAVRRREMRVAAVGSNALLTASDRLINAAVEHKDWPAALHAARQFLLLLQSQGAIFVNDQPYSTTPHLVHWIEAQAAVARGNDAVALWHLRGMLTAIPIETDSLISLVNAAKATHPQLARTLFDTAAGSFDHLLTAYPDHPWAHNDLAWLCVRCGYDLDRAMTHANRAVALEPHNAASLDTLAELYLLKGDKAGAMALLARCEALEPHDPRRAARRREFEGR